jgi:hypothetical protein
MGLFSILAVRLHYTLDVVLAVYFSITVWSAYHRIAHDIAVGHHFSMIWFIDHVLIYPAIRWLETPQTREDFELAVSEPEGSAPKHSAAQRTSRDGSGSLSHSHSHSNSNSSADAGGSFASSHLTSSGVHTGHRNEFNAPPHFSARASPVLRPFFFGATNNDSSSSLAASSADSGRAMSPAPI